MRRSMNTVAASINCAPGRATESCAKGQGADRAHLKPDPSLPIPRAFSASAMRCILAPMSLRGLGLGTPVWVPARIASRSPISNHSGKVSISVIRLAAAAASATQAASRIIGGCAGSAGISAAEAPCASK